MNGMVVDTNIFVSANGIDTHADEMCQFACVEAMKKIMSKGIVFLDNGNLILKEYIGKMNPRNPPGAGDEFFIHILNHRYSENHVRFITITRIDDEQRDFEELPNNQLDPSDRKFLAVAVVAGAPILNATDSDWHEQQALLDRLSVQVEQLCPQHAVRAD